MSTSFLFQVNNAGVGGSIVDSEAFKKAVVSFLCKLKLAKIEFAIGFKIAFFFKKIIRTLEKSIKDPYWASF